MSSAVSGEQPHESRALQPAHASPARASRLVLVAAAGSLFLLVVASQVWFFGWDKATPDVTAYWRAAVSLRLGEPVYVAPPPGVSPKAFLYPPAFAALFAPLTLLKPLWGYAAWMALHFVFLGWMLWVTARLAEVNTAGARTRYLALVLLWLPVAIGSDFEEGQVNLLVACLVATSLLRVEQARWWSAGALLALASHVKLLPAVLLLPLLLQGRRRAVATTVVAIGALALLPALWTVPREGLLDGLRHCIALHVDFAAGVLAPAVTDAKVVGDEQFYIFNSSLVAVLHRWFGEGVAFFPFPELAAWRGPLLFELPRPLLRLAGVALGSAFFLASLVLARKAASQRTGRVASVGLAWIAVELTALNFWEHHLVYLVVLLAPLAAVEIASPGRRRALAMLSVAIFALWTGPYLLNPVALAFDSKAAHALLSATRTWGVPAIAVVALCVLSLVVHRDARDPAEPG